MKVKTLSNTQTNLLEIESYVKKCISDQQMFYYFHLHESYINWPKHILSTISEYKKKVIEKSRYVENTSKFIIVDYEINTKNYRSVPTISLTCKFIKQNQLIFSDPVRSDKFDMYIDNFYKVYDENIIFYTSFFSGDMDEISLTIPIEIFDNWDISKCPTEISNIVDKISAHTDSNIIYNVLDVFGLNDYSTDYDFYSHENYGIILKILDKFNIR